MYGVPSNLDLRPFHGDYLTQICLGSADLQFKFGAGRTISVWGHCELRDAAGTLIDQACDTDREKYCVHRLLMATVTGSRVDPPRSFTLAFDNGMALTVFDDSANYESFSIQPGDVFV